MEVLCVFQIYLVGHFWEQDPRLESTLGLAQQSIPYVYMINSLLFFLYIVYYFYFELYIPHIGDG